ncbi:hypothetical protein ACEZ3G_11350 [Maribacter algicola]|uniref:Uncharacterized protein n=1 Tax=Meishania litoralis TaxID=3434685 RepID=A0ACC7LM09_9FLAO
MITRTIPFLSGFEKILYSTLRKYQSYGRDKEVRYGQEKTLIIRKS